MDYVNLMSGFVLVPLSLFQALWAWRQDILQHRSWSTIVLGTTPTSHALENEAGAQRTSASTDYRELIDEQPKQELGQA